MSILKNVANIKTVKYILAGKCNFGRCMVCGQKTIFVEEDERLRDYYRCIRCRSIPRNRALIRVLEIFYPDYRKMKIHESSPGGPASDKLKRECSDYTFSHFFPDVTPGDQKDGMRCENLEETTFEDKSFDLLITQDVMEHVMNPDRAFREIARILRPGGAHVFTVPMFHREKTLIRALQTEKGIEYLQEKQYHRNPVDKQGSLVTREWGEDMVDYIAEHSGMSTSVYLIKDRKLGIDGRFLEVFVSRQASV